MTTSGWHPMHTTSATGDVFDYPFDELLLDERPAISTEQADCCIARAAFRVVLPVTSSRPRPAELLFCSHHLRKSATRLRDACAAVFDEHHRLVAAAVAS